MNYRNNRKVLLVVFSALIISVVTITMAYAALSTVLNVTGTAQVQSAKWDIHFANVNVKSGSVAASKKPTISGNTVDFSVTLNKPGDFYEFIVDVVNKGTIDAMIENIVKTPTLTAIQEKYLTYNITYSDGNTIGKNQLLKANKQKTLKVNLTYRKDLNISDIPSSPDTLHLSFQGVFSQADGNSVVGPEGAGDEITKLVRMVSGDISNPQIGDMFAIKNERFHIYSSTETTITGIAEYNLYVGGYYDTIVKLWTPYEQNEATGIQNSEMKAFIGTEIRKGTSSFTPTGNKYAGSTVEKYVNTYHDILTSYGVNIEEARLIREEELINIFNCERYGKCPTTYPWIYSTSYWTQTPFWSDFVYRIVSNNELTDGNHNDSSYSGVRPVITILKTEFN